jgi:hypothetical protein
MSFLDHMPILAQVPYIKTPGKSFVKGVILGKQEGGKWARR